MVKQCIIRACDSKLSDKVGFFRFPSCPVAAQTWLEKLKHGLPEGFALREKDRRNVCGRHFNKEFIRDLGTVKKLKFNAVPNFIEPPPLPTSTTKPKINKTPAQIIGSLQNKVIRLKEKIKKLENDPPVNLIKNNRHKLREFMNEEAYLMFDCCIENYQRPAFGRRHSFACKKFTSRIFHDYRETYNFIQPIFALPSAKTVTLVDKVTDS